MQSLSACSSLDSLLLGLHSLWHRHRGTVGVEGFNAKLHSIRQCSLLLKSFTEWHTTRDPAWNENQIKIYGSLQHHRPPLPAPTVVGDGGVLFSYIDIRTASIYRAARLILVQLMLDLLQSLPRQTKRSDQHCPAYYCMYTSDPMGLSMGSLNTPSPCQPCSLSRRRSLRSRRHASFVPSFCP